MVDTSITPALETEGELEANQARPLSRGGLCRRSKHQNRPGHDSMWRWKQETQGFKASLGLMNKRIKKAEGDEPFAEIGVGEESVNRLTRSPPGSSQLGRRT